MGELRESVSVTLDSNGYGTVVYQRGRAGNTWRVTRFSASGSNNAKLRIYRNAIDPGMMVDNTYNANNDTSETNLLMYDSDVLWFEWINGTPGANMNCTVIGVI